MVLEVILAFLVVILVVLGMVQLQGGAPKAWENVAVLKSVNTLDFDANWWNFNPRTPCTFLYLSDI